MKRIERRWRRSWLGRSARNGAGLPGLPGLQSAIAGIGVALLSASAAAATCTVVPVVAPVFASYQTATRDATGSITVQCTALVTDSVSYSIRLGLGNQAIGTQRRMALNGSFLSYNLFCTNGYSQVWADGLGGTCAPTGGGTVLVAFPLVSTHTVYARIPAGQFVAAGAYLDTVTITVLY